MRSDSRLDAAQAALDTLTRRVDAVDNKVRADFTGYVAKRVGGYEIIEGVGPDGGYFLARPHPRSGERGTTRKFRSLSEAIHHAEMEQPHRFDAEARTDPPVSEAQRRAMRAAAAGNSNLDIPKSVGEEFSEADPGGKLPESKADAEALDREDWKQKVLTKYP